ncbi:hypothetical protein KC799_25535 [candidate division KSB1 bacterium]|nr:hypothetical protein [candidate division KSB1 bacterium]
MKWTEKLVCLAGILLFMLGFLMLAGSVANMVDPEKNRSIVEWIMWSAFLGGVPMAAGIFLCVKMKKNAGKRNHEKTERELLQLAKANNGRLNIAIVSMNMAISSGDAKKLLDECHLNNLANIEASDTGVVTYIFNV